MKSQKKYPALLPEPKRVLLASGHFHLPATLLVRYPDHIDPRLPLALQVLAEEFVRHGTVLDARPSTGIVDPARIGMEILLDSTLPSKASYRLKISNRKIILTGRNEGLFYALQTLRQLINPRDHLSGCIPCLTIFDRPDLTLRGYYLDISRGKVPTLNSLKRLVDRLAQFKINHLQLYIEHVFDFEFDRDIAANCDALTAGEIRELDAYCHDRFIELVPSLACFGHMGRVLSLPQYRHLAETPWPADDWAQATWRQRLHGATINPRLKESKQLLRHMITELAPLFKSRWFNICGDETYDLGRGSNKNYAKRYGVHKLYVDHVAWLHRELNKRGKQTMCWSDVLLQHPSTISNLPPGLAVLDWGYETTTPFAKAQPFHDLELPVIACPSVRGFKSIFNDVETARGNISGYAKTAARLNYTGLLNTDWGDMGHFNLPAASLHGLLLGAHLSWNASGSSDRKFDTLFSKVLQQPSLAKAFRFAGHQKGFRSWPFFLSTPQTWSAHALPSADQLEKYKARVCDAEAIIHGSQPNGVFSNIDRTELLLATFALRLNLTKAQLVQERVVNKKAPNAARVRRWQARIENYMELYGTHWHAHNKPLGITDLQRGVQKMKTATGRALLK